MMTSEEARIELADSILDGLNNGDAAADVLDDLLSDVSLLMQAIGAEKEVGPQQIDGFVGVMASRWVTPWQEEGK